MVELIKILELFGGIGAPRKALENLGVDIKSIDYVEVLPYAVQAYNNMFDHLYKPQDIKSWNMNVDLLVHGSPCQDFSKNGKNDLSTGRSILYERTLEIIEHELHPKPKVIIWENVTGLISKRHIEHFNHYLSSMERLGYKNTFKVLNAKDYGTPQNRERVFTVSILNELNLPDYEFPNPIPLTKTLKEYIDFSIKEEDYPLSDNEKSLFFTMNDDLYIHENTKSGKRKVEYFDSINVERPNSKTRRGRVQQKSVPTLTTSPNIAIYYENVLRKLSIKEMWLLMGFTENDYNNVLKTNMPTAAMSKLAGNSIVVSVLEHIFNQLFNLNILNKINT